MTAPGDLTIRRWPAIWGGTVGATHKGLVREGNEDRIGVSADGCTIALADGMGGHADGELASKAAVDAVIGDWPGTFTGLFANAQRAVLALGRSGGGRIGRKEPGSTLVVVRLNPKTRHARIGWTGDSRCYVFNGVLRQATRDHAAWGGITQCLGGGVHGEGPPGEYTKVVLSSGSLLMLCSDGVHGRGLGGGRRPIVADGAIAEILGAATSRGEAVERIVAAAFAAGAPDNVSVMLVRVM